MKTLINAIAPSLFPKKAPFAAMIAPLVSLSLAMTGCVVDHEQQEDAASRHEEITEGIALGNSDFPATGYVGLLAFGGISPFCTATLIGPRTVLTAGHCSDPYVTQVGAYNRFVLNNTRYSGTIHPHPQYVNGYSPGENVDIALFTLNSAPPASIKRACLEKPLPVAGDDYFIVGVGGPSGPTTQKTMGVATVLAPPAGGDLSQMFTMSSATYGYQGGDSGGPAGGYDFLGNDPNHGQTYVWGIGVGVSADEYGNQYSTSVTVSQWKDWINSTTVSYGGVSWCP